MSAEAMAIPGAGDIVGEGRFELGSKLGEGGMSTVFVARDRFLDCDVALKLLIPRYVGRSEREQRFLNEAEYLRRVQDHVHITRVVDSGRLRDRNQWPWLSTEIMSGETLDWLIIRRSLDIHKILEIARQLAEAVRACHEAGVVHRDLTPSNVFVLDDGSIKLFDFSHAGDLRGPKLAVGAPERLTRVFETPGTVGYIAPEQAANAAPAESMDSFGFGVLLYELVSGSNPYSEYADRDAFIQAQCDGSLEPPRLYARAYEAPEELAELVHDCMQRDAGRRPLMPAILARLDAIAKNMRTANARASSGEEPTGIVPPLHAEAESTEDVTLAMDAPAMIVARPRKADPVTIGAWTSPRAPAPVLPITREAVPEDRTEFMPVSPPVTAPPRELAFARPPEQRPSSGLPPAGAELEGGRIALGEKYADGGMSVVHLGFEKATERMLAVKLLIPRYKGRPEREQRLLDEGRYLEELSGSPYIVDVVSHGRLAKFDGWPFVATEFMKGKSLSELLLREDSLSPLTPPRICDIAHQLAQALRFAHQHGIVHRDVTMSNVYVCREPRLFEPDDGPDHVKLFDFSHAGRLDGPHGPPGSAGRLTGVHDVPGTHGFMSPEQARAEPATTAMDVFAFGAVVYELVTRRELFDVEDRHRYIDLAAHEVLDVPQLGAAAHGIPEAWAELVNRCTALDPATRPSMDEIIEQLTAIQSSLERRSEPAVEEPELAFARPPQLREAPAMPSVLVGADFAEPSERRQLDRDSSRGLDPENPSVGEDDPAPIAPSRRRIVGLLAGLGFVVIFLSWIILSKFLGADGDPEQKIQNDRDQSATSPHDHDAGAESGGASPDPDTGGADSEDETSGMEVVPEVDPVEADPQPENGKPKNGKPRNGKPRNGKPKDGEPDNGDPEDAGPPNGKPAKGPACEGVEADALAAHRDRDWARVAKLSAKKACWTSQDERVRLRVNALSNLARYDECIKAGAGSTDPKVKSIVGLCEAATN